MATHYFGRWVLATLGGWCLGVVVMVLLAVLGEQLGIGEQSALGVGMGFGVGLAQWRIGRGWFGASSQWAWATVVGLGAAFVLYDLLGGQQLGGNGGDLLIPVALGSVLVGLWQRRLLRARSARGDWWVAACAGSWVLAVESVLLVPTDSPARPMPPWFGIAAIVFGGVALGIMTGSALVWTLRPPSELAATGHSVQRSRSLR